MVYIHENLFNSEYTTLEETPKQNTHSSLRFNHREGTAGSFKRPFFCKDPLAAFIALHSLYLSTLFWASKQFEVLMSDPTGVYRNGVIPATHLQLYYYVVQSSDMICSTSRSNWPTYIAQFEEC